MADRLQVYKCELCGNIVEVVHAGAGDLVCCGESMVLLEENTVRVKLGSQPSHLMTCIENRLLNRRHFRCKLPVVALIPQTQMALNTCHEAAF